MRVFFKQFNEYPTWMKEKYGFKKDDIVAILKIKHFYIATLIDVKDHIFEVSINSTRKNLDSITYQREFYSWNQKNQLKNSITRAMNHLKKDKDIKKFKEIVEKELYFNVTWLNGKAADSDYKRYLKN